MTFTPDRVGQDSRTGGGIESASFETTPYPSVGDNPAFADFVRGEIGPDDVESVALGADVPGEGESKRKPGPGRPPGTGKHQRAARALNEFQAAGIDETIMASVFKGAFQALAFALDEKGLNLSAAEADAFARPACVLWGYYMPNTISPVQAAWSQMAMVALGVFGARSEALSRGWRKRTGLKARSGISAPAPIAPAIPPIQQSGGIPDAGPVKFTPAKAPEGGQ